MGNKELHANATEQEVASYKVISFHGNELPEQYVGLVYSKWMRSLRYGNDFFKMIDSDSYYEAYESYIRTTLNRPSSLVRLGVLADDDDVVLGFSVSRWPILDYIHVHRDFRRSGIGTHLVPTGIETITHITNTGLSIWGSKYGRVKFNPFA